MKRTTEESRELAASIHKRKAAGDTHRVIAKALGISPSTVHALSKRYPAAPAPSDAVEVTDSGKEHVVARYIDGDTVELLHSGAVKTVEDLMEIAGFDPEEWLVVSAKPNAWTTSMRHAGRIVQVQNYQVKPTLVRRPKPGALPAAYQPPRVRLPTLAPPNDEEEILVVLPDTHIGHRRFGTRLYPMHDRRALSVASQVIADLKTKHRNVRVIQVGDWLDGHSAGKYTREPELLGTEQAAVDEAYFWIQELQVDEFIGGNHEMFYRARRTYGTQGSEVLSIRPAQTESPALSVATLLHFSALGIRDHGPYGTKVEAFPDATSRTVLTHGDDIKPASTKTTHYNLVHGHTHRLSVARRRLSLTGEQVFVAEAGCLCRVDALKPPYGSTGDADWQQGFVVLSRSGDHVSVDLVHINDGVAHFRGRWREGVDPTPHLSALIGQNLAPMNASPGEARHAH